MSEPPAYPGMPRWVKIITIVAVIALVLFVILMITGGGRHGPRRHMSSSKGGAPATHSHP